MAHAGLIVPNTGMSRSGAPQLVTRNVLANLGMADEVQKLVAAMADDVKNAERLVDGDRHSAGCSVRDTAVISCPWSDISLGSCRLLDTSQTPRKPGAEPSARHILLRPARHARNRNGTAAPVAHLDLCGIEFFQSIFSTNGIHPARACSSCDFGARLR